MKTKKLYYSSSNDEDEPLVLKRCKKDDKVSLHSYSLEKCDFCDGVFYNKYDLLVHNSQHIIIPLLKQEIHLCTICYQHFTSQEKLNYHKTDEHNILVPNLLESIIKKQPVIKCFDDLTEILKVKNVKTNVIEKAPFVKKDTGAKGMQASLENIVNARPVVKCDNSLTELINSSKSGSTDGVNTVSATVAASGVRRASSNIRSRIIFEDEIEDDEVVMLSPNLLNDLTTDCKVDLETNGFFNALERDKKDKARPFNGKIMLGSKIAKSDVVSYEDLLIPGDYACRTCYKPFYNRYKWVIHETTHISMRLRRPPLCWICDRYIAGNHRSLQRHISNRHPHSLNNANDLTRCAKCDLKYHNYENHASNYHNVYKCPCGERFLNKKILENHERNCEKKDEENCDETAAESSMHILPDSYKESSDKRDEVKVSENNIKIFKLCQMCAMFKQSHKYKFICVGELSEIGSRQTCEGCKKEFFNIKILKRVPRKPEYSKYDHAKTYYDSNETKLKHFQRKLKYMNKMSRL